ncbi:translation initiation factor IF-2 [Xanthobacter sp. TB0136]|uniref:translation initiation factor IF-2 n=1 Tax=Xanthobacter sp. TB0136 TaxID=3459177 RepID=UPI0040397694
MNDTKTPGDKTPPPSTGKTLTLKRPVEQGTVRQSFSHGRSKQVVVEKVKRRVIAPADAAATPAAPAPAPAKPAAAAPQPPVKETVATAPAAPAKPAPQAAAPATPAPVAEQPKAEPVVAAPVKAPEAPVAASTPEPVKAAPVQEAPAKAEPVKTEPAKAAAPKPAEPAAAPARPAAQAPRTSEQAPRGNRAQDAGSTRTGASQSQNRPGSGLQRAGAGAGGANAGRPGQQRTGGQQDRRSGGPGGASGRPGQRQGGSGVVLRTLTEEERNARASALADARARAVEEQKMAEERRIAEEEARRRAERERAERAEREAAEARKREEDARRAQEEENKRRAEQEARKRLGAEETTSTTRAPASAAPRPAGTASRTAAESEDERRAPRRGPGARPVAPVKVPRAPAGPEKQRGRLTVVKALSGDDERQRSVASFRRRTQRMSGKGNHQEQKEKIAREVILPETITIQELANRMSERGVDVIRLLMKQGQMLKITDVIDADTAELIAADMGHTVRRVSESDVEEGLFDAPDAPETLKDRPPVVTIMGHVDHGKTSLLDALREANVVSGEAGGITQHIGAYQVTSPLGGKITFIDTPGHAAFTAMRARGAKVTDIVVLVVAADDGVMPQTVEAINHARAAGAPVIVAINKIDKPEAKPERVRTELLQHQVQVESLGGETLEVEISAKKRINLDKLLEAITLQAEMLNLEANPDRAAEGTVVEAKLDRGRGPVATVLVQRGTLHVSDIVVAGAEWGRVRALITDTGGNTAVAGPSMPVEVLGFNGTPEAGDRLAVVENEARAREITDYRQRQKREKAAARSATIRGSLEQMMNQVKTSNGRKEFPLIIKGDVQGSVEAIIGALEKLGNDEVQARVIHSGAGGINESDVTLAETSGAAIIAFNVRANKEAREAAERAGIEIRYYNIIYDLVDDVKQAMSGLLAPITRETMLGNAEIRQIFAVSKVGKVAGCLVTDGVVERGQHVRLIRDNVVIHEGKLSTLNRFKDAVNTVHSGQECGMSFETYQDMREGDVIECYRVETVQRSL